jgi:hypothetical protein
MKALADETGDLPRARMVVRREEIRRRCCGWKARTVDVRAPVAPSSRRAA